jgi:hypothetical protein
MKARAAAVALCVLVSGCADQGFQREYVYMRQEPPAAFALSDPKEPTEFRVRLRIDRAQKLVNWMEAVRFQGSEIDHEIRAWTTCTFFDDENWECSPPPIGDFGVIEQNRIEMRNGVLYQEYWSESRTFRASWRFVGW